VFLFRQAILAGNEWKANAKGVSRLPSPYAIGPAVISLALTALAVVTAWWWLGLPVKLPAPPLAAGDTLYCLSYAPFRGAITSCKARAATG
jgi:hypothetical protein